MPLFLRLVHLLHWNTTFERLILFLLHFFKGIRSLATSWATLERMKEVLISFPEAMNHLAFTDVLMVEYTAKNGPQEQKEFFLLESLVSTLISFMLNDYVANEKVFFSFENEISGKESIYNLSMIQRKRSIRMIRLQTCILFKIGFYQAQKFTCCVTPLLWYSRIRKTSRAKKINYYW